MLRTAHSIFPVEKLYSLTLSQEFQSGIPFNWRRKWQPTPVFLPGESHGQRSLVGYSHGGHKDLDVTEHTYHLTRLIWRMEKAMATHSSTLAWRIPWTEGPGGHSPWGRWGLDTTERLHFHCLLSCTGEGNGNPLQRSCLENPRDRGAWWAAVYGVAQSRTRLRRLSSSSGSVATICILIYLISRGFFYSYNCFNFHF